MRAPASTKDPTPLREHLRAAAARGHRPAIEALAGPEVPDGLVYLWDWFGELERGREITMNGVAPLSWTQVDAWARLLGHDPSPEEVEALFTLDVIVRNPEPGVH